MKPKSTLRADKVGKHNTHYLKNKNRLMKITELCNICGRALNINIKWPDPLAPVCDHIIPIALGGHPSDINNLQIVHNKCNASKGAKLRFKKEEEVHVGDIKNKPKNLNRDLPQSMDWSKCRSKESQELDARKKNKHRLY